MISFRYPSGGLMLAFDAAVPLGRVNQRIRIARGASENEKKIVQ